MIHLDGNGAAGVLREVFAAEMTDSSCTCAGCGRSSAVGGLLLYGGAMGTVLRCPTCGAVVMRVTGSPRRWTLEIRGLVRIDRTDGPP